jgi:hypothetical protein
VKFVATSADRVWDLESQRDEDDGTPCNVGGITWIMPRAEFPSQRARAPETPPVSPGCPPALCVAHPNSHRVPCGIILLSPHGDVSELLVNNVLTQSSTVALSLLYRAHLRHNVVFVRAANSTRDGPPDRPLDCGINSRANSRPRGRHGSKRACRSSWSTRRGAPATPESCEFVAGVQHVRRETVPEHIRRDVLRDLRRPAAWTTRSITLSCT